MVSVSPIMLSTDSGNNFCILVPLAASYREDHIYIYEMIGQGYPLYVRLDDAPLNDNYGQIFIAIENTK